MAIFIILSFIRWDGSPAFHIIVGVVCAVFFTLHVLLHRKWLTAQTKKLSKGKVSAKVIRLYLVDVLLLIVWTISIVTGILAIQPYLVDSESASWLDRIHGITARLAVVLVIIHLIQHFKQIRSYFKVPRKAS